MVTLAALTACASAAVDLPVATGGTEQWAATVAKAMSYGAKDSGTAMTNFQSFQSKVMANVKKQVRTRSFPKVSPVALQLACLLFQEGYHICARWALHTLGPSSPP